MKWARDYLSIARQSAVAVRAINDEMDERRAALTLQAQRYANGVRTGETDPQALIVAYLDAQRDADARLVEHEERLLDAHRLLFGFDGRHGVAGHIGLTCARIVERRWLLLQTWTAIAASFGKSRKWCTNRADDAIGFMDEYGEARLRNEYEIDADFYESLRDDWGDGR